MTATRRAGTKWLTNGAGTKTARDDPCTGKGVYRLCGPWFLVFVLRQRNDYHEQQLQHQQTMS